MDGEKNKSLYVIVSMTGTLPSRLIRRREKSEFSHVSISLDRRLHHMYSFGRLCKWMIYPGGLVHEIPDRNVYRRFPHTKIPAAMQPPVFFHLMCGRIRICLLLLPLQRKLLQIQSFQP